MVIQTHFTYFYLLYKYLNNLKIHKFLTNFNNISFSFVFFMVKPNMRKLFSFTFFSFPKYFLGTKHVLKVSSFDLLSIGY